jgi:ABC-2 type transport system permease protein
MIRTLRRKVVTYWAIAVMSVKTALAYTTYAWLEFGLQFLWMIAFVYFWRAVYADQTTIAGMDLRQTLDYIILAQVLMPLVERYLILEFGWMIREGHLAIELLRPLDFQAATYVGQLIDLIRSLVYKLPLLLVGWLFFGLRLPSDLLVWGAFVVTLFLGHAVIFCFEWAFSCLAFYTTETWGLYQSRVGIARFISGALVPLAMMPGWLRKVAEALPFAQAISAPVSLLSGLTPLAEAPRVWLTQLCWLVGLAVLSRLVFAVAVRKVTIQGG